MQLVRLLTPAAGAGWRWGQESSTKVFIAVKERITVRVLGTTTFMWIASRGSVVIRGHNCWIASCGSFLIRGRCMIDQNNCLVWQFRD